MDEFTFAEKLVFETGGVSIRSCMDVGRCNALPYTANSEFRCGVLYWHLLIFIIVSSASLNLLLYNLLYIPRCFSF
jgi:hypothetical protein